MKFDLLSKIKHPWQKGKSGFSWSKYLEHTKSKAAPVNRFKDGFPYMKSNFKVGMKLEGIDPNHPSHFCVLTVAEVVGNYPLFFSSQKSTFIFAFILYCQNKYLSSGFRIRLHFDGYAETFDFWTNADSMDIFPIGWSEKNGHKLHPPKGYVASNFNWNAYLKTCKASAAPKTLFTNRSVSLFCFLKLLFFLFF